MSPICVRNDLFAWRGGVVLKACVCGHEYLWVFFQEIHKTAVNSYSRSFWQYHVVDDPVFDSEWIKSSAPIRKQLVGTMRNRISKQYYYSMILGFERKYQIHRLRHPFRRCLDQKQPPSSCGVGDVKNPGSVFFWTGHIMIKKQKPRLCCGHGYNATFIFRPSDKKNMFLDHTLFKPRAFRLHEWLDISIGESFCRQ